MKQVLQECFGGRDEDVHSIPGFSLGENRNK